MEIQNPHDSYFKSLFSEVEQVASFIEGFLPKDISGKVDIKTLKILTKSFVDEKLKQYHSDIVYQCKLSAKEAYLYFFLSIRVILIKMFLFKC